MKKYELKINNEIKIDDKKMFDENTERYTMEGRKIDKESTSYSYGNFRRFLIIKEENNFKSKAPLMKLCNELTRVIDLNLNSSLEITKINNIDVIREAYQKVFQSDLKEGKRYLLSKIEDVFVKERKLITFLNMKPFFQAIFHPIAKSRHSDLGNNYIECKIDDLLLGISIPTRLYIKETIKKENCNVYKLDGKIDLVYLDQYKFIDMFKGIFDIYEQVIMDDFTFDVHESAEINNKSELTEKSIREVILSYKGKYQIIKKYTFKKIEEEK